MGNIFAYIVHYDGTIDDSALELTTAAKKLDPSAEVTAVVTGAGASLDQVCDEMAA